jgi:N-carbamoyl-L-amino-acid hydrolase
LMADADDVVRFTVGRFEVHPNSPNTIPDEVLFTVDFRHPKSEVLANRGDQVERVCRENAGPCDVVVDETLDASPTFLDAGLASVIRDAADVLGVAHSDIVSGATHDAKYAALHSPSAMLFIRCRDGVSHTVLEYASPDDMTTGTRVLAATIATLATS